MDDDDQFQRETEEQLAQAFNFDSVRLGGFVSFLIRTISAGAFGPVK